MKEESKFNPFAGIGVGTVYTLRDTDMGLYRWEEDAWSFSLRPEAGFIYMLKRTLGVKLAIRYNQVFKPAEMDEDQSFVAIAIGLAWTKQNLHQ